jgi:hypothetical protein
MKKEVKKVTDYEKKVKEVNDSMSSVLKKKRELEDSHRKQEALINKIKKLDEGNKASVAGLSKKKEEEEAKETNKFDSLVADLDAQRKELTTKKANLPLGALTYADKKAFIQSEAGQVLMEKMNSQTLKTNAEELMDEVDDLATTKRVMDIDPADEYSETATILVNTYSWSGLGLEPEEPVSPGDGQLIHLIEGGEYTLTTDYANGGSAQSFPTKAGKDKIIIGGYLIKPYLNQRTNLVEGFGSQTYTIDKGTGEEIIGTAIMSLGEFEGNDLSWTITLEKDKEGNKVIDNYKLSYTPQIKNSFKSGQI